MLLYAHRGAPAQPRLENTVPAIASALAAGADGVEVDLRLSADGVLVVSHDVDLARLGALGAVVAAESWSALLRRAAAVDVPLARVEDVFDALGDRPVVLEVKQPPGPAGPTVAALLACVRLAGGPVTVSSFAPAVVAAVRDGAGRGPVRTALLGRPLTRPGSLLRQALAAGHDEIHPHVVALLAEPQSVAAAHRVGMSVVPWTVNGARALRRLHDAGVDGVITDEPAAAVAALAGRVTRAR